MKSCSILWTQTHQIAAVWVWFSEWSGAPASLLVDSSADAISAGSFSTHSGTEAQVKTTCRYSNGAPGRGGGRNVIVAGLFVQHMLKLITYWDFNTQVSLKFDNNQKKKKSSHLSFFFSALLLLLLRSSPRNYSLPFLFCFFPTVYLPFLFSFLPFIFPELLSVYLSFLLSLFSFSPSFFSFASPNTTA